MPDIPHFSPPSVSPPSVSPPSAPAPSIPPAMGNCVTTLQLAGSGTSPQETAHQLIRSGDGKIRVDTGNVSVITDPATQKTILLDHLNKEARALAMPSGQLPQMQIPGMPQVAAPTLPTVAPPAVQSNIQDLGKQLIDGEEAVGKRITIQPPPMPAMPNMPGVPGMPGVLQMPSPPGVPGMPGMPGVPQMPGMPGVPGMPAMPAKPQPPNVTEIWTNPNLHLPVLTQVNGAFGQQTCRCKNQAIPEPDPSTFEIPKDYKDLTQG